MKKTVLFFLLFTMTWPWTASAKLKVVTTIPDLAALAREVGGEWIDTMSLARGDQDPHTIEPKPSYAVKLNRADLLVSVGLELEVGWLPVLLTQSHNPRIQSGGLGHLDASEGISILEIPVGKIDRSQGDIHPNGNPHYWMKPQNGLTIAQRIAERLAQLDPAHAKGYQDNFGQFSARLKNKIALWERRMVSFKGTKIVTHHKSFSYFVDWAGLSVVAEVEPQPGIPPPPAYILSLIEKIRSEKIPLIITENYYDPKPSRELAQRTGARVLILPTSVGGELEIKTYEDLFEALIQRLKGVL